VRVLLAQIYLERGDRAQAIEYARSALRIDPGNKEALALLSQLGVK
jgi:Tfp pilus assembly protein PilF